MMGLKFEQTDESWSIFRFTAIRYWIAARKLVRNQHHHLKKESFADDQNDFFFRRSMIFITVAVHQISKEKLGFFLLN